MKKCVKAVAAAIVATALLASCASTGKAASDGSGTEKSLTASSKSKKAKKSKKVKFDQAAYDEAYAKGDLETCIAMLRSQNQKGDNVKFNLDEAMLQNFAKDYASSATLFNSTSIIMSQLTDEQTAAKTMQAALGSESAVTYAGATYEYFLVDAMNAVNYIRQNDYDNARAMVRRSLNNNKEKMNELKAQAMEVSGESDKALESEEVKVALDTFSKAGIDIPFTKMSSAAPAKSTVIYETSPFISYMGALLFAQDGDFDTAREWASTLKSASLDRDDLSIPSGKGRLNVIALTDVIAKRSEKKSDTSSLPLPLSNGSAVSLNMTMVYPNVENVNHNVKSAKVTLSNGASSTAKTVEDFDDAVKIDVAFKARGAYNRSLFRNIARKGSAFAGGFASVMAAEEGLKKAANPIAQAAGQKALEAAVVGLQKGLDAIDLAEKADVRQCEYFPNKANVAGFTLEPGTYSITVEYFGDTGLLATETFENVKVDAGKMTLLASECLNPDVAK